MSTSIWPSSLPKPTIQGFGSQPVDSVIRTQMDSGPTRSRERTLSSQKLMTLRWVMPQEKLILFESYTKHTLKSGAAWVSISIGGETYELRFSAPYSIAPLAHNISEITTRVEVRGAPILSTAALTFFTNNGLISSANVQRFKDYINVEHLAVFGRVKFAPAIAQIERFAGLDLLPVFGRVNYTNAIVQTNRMNTLDSRFSSAFPNFDL